MKTCHFTYCMSHDFNPKNLGISGLHVEQSLKITTLHTRIANITTILTLQK